MTADEQPKNRIDSDSTHKEGMADPKGDLTPEEIKHFFTALSKLLEQSQELFFTPSHFWPKRKSTEPNHENSESDYQWMQHRYRQALNNAHSFFLNPNRATYQLHLVPVRERLADKTDLEHLREMVNKYMTPGHLPEGQPDLKHGQQKAAREWIKSLDKLTGDFVARIDAMYPPGQAEGKTT